MSIPRIIKPSARRLAAVLAPARLYLMSSSSLLILMYHRVLPPGHSALATEQPGMFVHPETFSRNLDWLKDFVEIVDLADWVRRTSDGVAVPSLAAAITFDDGWLDNYEFAFPILRRANVPATIFVCPDLIARRGSFWPTQLARIVSAPLDQNKLPPSLRERAIRIGLPISAFSAGLSPTAIDSLITECKGISDVDMHDIVAELQSHFPMPTRYTDLVDWTQLHEMQDSGFVKIGSHTRSHLRLSESLPTETLKDEISGSKLDLEGRLRCEVSAFAYPNGDTPVSAVAEVRRSYSLGVTTQFGVARPDTDPVLLPRIGIHQGVADSRSRFIARLVGWG